jgi:hypothetical protein
MRLTLKPSLELPESVTAASRNSMLPGVIATSQGGVPNAAVLGRVNNKICPLLALQTRGYLSGLCTVMEKFLNGNP